MSDRDEGDDLRARHLLDAFDLPRDAGQVLCQPRCHTSAFCLRYLERCEELGRRDPGGALLAAQVAPSLAQRIPRWACRGEAEWCALQVRALTAVGGAQRATGDFASSEAAFRVARFLYADDANAAARADLLHKLALLRRDQRRFRESEQALGTAIEIFKDLRLLHPWGCALVDRGIVRIRVHKPWKALGDLTEAHSLVDRKRSFATYYSAAHNLTVALADDPEASPREALYWLRYAQRINRDPESAFSQLELLWTEGRILEKQSLLSEAEHFLETVRQRLLEGRMIYDYVLATLDLAGIYLRLDRRREIRQLAVEIFPVFHQLRHDREAVELLKRFHRAAIVDGLEAKTLGAAQRLLKTRATNI